MAGRGTDIMLGGNPEYLARNDLRRAGVPEEIINEAVGYADTDNEEIVSARRLYAEKLAEHRAVTSAEAEKVRSAGGLFILGTERHESRRIDNQLRGRAGRQGDPGETRFMIALTDDIMRLFGSERIMDMLDSLGLDEDTPIDQKMLSGAIENAQKRVESRNFQSRKSVLEYDDVMNKQREIIYDQRRRVLDGEDISDRIRSMIADVIGTAVESGFGHENAVDARALEEIVSPFRRLFLGEERLDAPSLTRESLTELLTDRAGACYDRREKEFGFLPDGVTPLMRELERVVLLRVVDEYWMDHIDAMQELRQGVGLRAYGQINPVDEYKREGFDMFEAMIAGMKEEVVRRIFTVRVRRESDLDRKSVSKTSVNNPGGDGSDRPRPVRAAKKIGRNDPCPCGKLRPNGLPMKYKDCCGRNA